MRVFELVGSSHGQRPGKRVAVIGTCRVHDPFETLVEQGRAVRLWMNHSSATYTLGEALQIVRYTRGEIDIARDFRPFIFSPSEGHTYTPADKRMLETVDAVFVEVADLRHITHDALFFRASLFYGEFVSRYGAAMLAWYRAFSLGQSITDEVVIEALDKLGDISTEQRAHIERVLRHTLINKPSVEKATSLTVDIMFDHSKTWTLVSHFIVPGVGGTLMKDRAELIEVVREVSRRAGTRMFDPSVILECRGRQGVLANEGRDVYHYNPSVHEFVADCLLEEAGLLDVEGAPLGMPGPAPSPIKSPAARAGDLVNVALSVVHADRVGSLGVVESGLHAHYKHLLDSGKIAGPNEVCLADLIANFLPRYECYHVLRAGLGELAFMLAAMDLNVSAHDQHAGRFSAICAGLDWFATKHPDLVRRIAIGRAIIPQVSPKERVLAIVHHLIGFKPEDEDDILERLSQYQALLVDPKSFLFPRTTNQERDVLVESLRVRGFTHIRDFPTIGIVYCAQADSAVADRQS